jgi:hypothetical protein
MKATVIDGAGKPSIELATIASLFQQKGKEYEMCL